MLTSLNLPVPPHNEAMRLEVLNSLNLIDAAPEERFDRVTRLAKRLFNVPVAKVTLVASDTIFTVSCAGAEADTGTHIPRELSFCGLAILCDDILVVPDALLDPRFRDSPLVTGEPHIRFYAGCPLTVAGGCRLGTLCLVDTVPRTLTEEDIKLLRDLAAMVEHEMAAVQMAIMDELTQLLNRRGLEVLGQQAIHLCIRLNKPASLLFFDLNHFKAINDTYGHAEGDHALQTFAETLGIVFRSSDLLGRLGGDEFVAMLINSSEAETIAAVERLRGVVAARNAADQRGYDICFSVGQIDFDARRHKTVAALLAEGDAEMYRNKQLSRRPTH